MSPVELVVLADAEAAGEAAAERIAAAVDAGGHIGLSGGKGPRAAYQRAAVLRPDWSGVELWWVDERCVPPGDADSNYRTVRESLLDGLSQLPAEVHRVRGELDYQVNRRAEVEIKDLAKRLNLLTDKIGDVDDLLREKVSEPR